MRHIVPQSNRVWFPVIEKVARPPTMALNQGTWDEFVVLWGHICVWHCHIIHIQYSQYVLDVLDIVTLYTSNIHSMCLPLSHSTHPILTVCVWHSSSWVHPPLFLRFKHWMKLDNYQRSWSVHHTGTLSRSWMEDMPYSASKLIILVSLRRSLTALRSLWTGAEII